MSKLSSDFVVELLKFCIKDERVGEVIMTHMKYSYFPTEEHKHIYKSIESYTKTSNTLITEGILAEEHKNDPKRRDLLLKIKEANLPTKDVFLQQFEEFIKDTMFVKVYEKQGELYNQGKKDEARQLMKDEGEKIYQFSLKASTITNITSKEAFNERRQKRIDADDGTNSRKIKFPFPQINNVTGGGIDLGDTFLFLAQSGVGKSKFLRSFAIFASSLGFRGLHISAEGTKVENEDAFDTQIAKSNVWRTEKGKQHKKELEEAGLFLDHVENSEGAVFLEAFEQFDEASLRDVRSKIIDIEKVHGKLHFLTLDYLELFHPGDGKKYSASGEQERAKMRKNGQVFKNIAVEFNIAGITATQGSTLAPELKNDPNFVQTRYNISGFKALVNAFSYFVTANQTVDEKEANVMRLFPDKVRKYKATESWLIKTDYEHEVFCDEDATIEMNGLQ